MSNRTHKAVQQAIEEHISSELGEDNDVGDWYVIVATTKDDAMTYTHITPKGLPLYSQRGLAMAAVDRFAPGSH